MSDNARTTRWPLVVGLVASLILTGVIPLVSASAGALAAEEAQARKSCCNVARTRACCGTGCCASPAPRPPMPKAPNSPTDDRRGGSSCPLALVATDVAADHDKAAADWMHIRSSLASTSSTLQSTHVRLNA